MERRTQIWLIAGFIVIVVVAVVLTAVFSQGAQQAASTFNATTVPAVDASDHVQGDTKSPVVVIEYGDFECPACGAWEPIVEQLEATYDNRVEFVFRNFPLTQLHQNAMIAAQAAEAANLQGKYWQMHDLLYKDQTQWVDAPTTSVVSQFFDGYAQSLGMNVTKFNTDIAASSTIARVERDITTGTNAQIDHTPTFFVNLKQIQNPDGGASFAAIIDAALAASSTPATQTATSSTQ